MRLHRQAFVAVATVLATLVIRDRRPGGGPASALPGYRTP